MLCHKSWRSLLVLCCPKRRRLKRQHWPTSMTFTLTKMSAQHWAKLAQFGMDCKYLEWLEDGVQVLGLDIRGGGRHHAMETGKCGSWHSWSYHKVDCFFPVWKTWGAPASVWLTLHSSESNKTQGECSKLRMGWTNEWCPRELWDVIVDWPSTSVMAKRTTRSKWCVTKSWNGYHPLWWQPLSWSYWLWTHPFCDLVTTGIAKFGKCSWQLSSVFYKWDALEQILPNNDTAFCSQLVRWFLCEGGGGPTTLQCLYAPSGNGIAERNHRSIKRIAARKQCTIAEATYWYNVTPKDSVCPVTVPANAIYRLVSLF